MEMIPGELCQQPAANPLKRANKWWGFYAGIASLGKNSHTKPAAMIHTDTGEHISQ